MRANNINHLAIAVLTLAAIFMDPRAAYAACSNPSGAAGEILYNTDYNVMQFCDNTNWVSMAGGSGGGGGTGVTDGDKGDLTVSGTGANWLIDDDVLNFTEFSDTLSLDASTDIAISGSQVLSLTNTGTANSFVVNDQASDTSPFVIAADGSVGVGLTAPTQALDVAGKATANAVIYKGVAGAPAPTTSGGGGGSAGLQTMTSTQRDALSSPATGLMIFNTTTSRIEFYNGTAWYGIGAAISLADGSSALKAAASCNAILTATGSATNGMYWLDPDGAGSIAAYQSYCLMTSHGGGWTLVVTNGSGSITSANYLNTSYADEFSGLAGDTALSIGRTAIPFTEIMFYQMTGNNAFIYTASASSLVGLPQGNYNLKSGATPLPNNPCSYTFIGTYSSTVLYHKYSNSAHRAMIFTPHLNNDSNQCGLFDFAGAHTAGNYFPSSGYSGEWRIYVR